MAKIASKEKRITDIASMLEKGLERKEILQKLSKSCKMSARTLDNEIKEAKVIVSKRNSDKEAIRVELTEQSVKDAVNEAILSDLEIEGILCKMIRGEMQVQEMLQGLPILKDVTPMEIINASKVIFAKRGSNAPTKVAQTDSQGKDIVWNEEKVYETK